MNVSHNHRANALYIELAEGEFSYSEMWPDGAPEAAEVMVVVDFDGGGRALGVEVLLPGHSGEPREEVEE